MLVTATLDQVSADDRLINEDDMSGYWQRASDEELDALRGGFVLPNGINIDFSIEKIIVINGELASSTSFQLSENMSSLQNMSPTQNGFQNISPAMLGSGSGVIVQNNMDYQTISTLNTINIELSNVRNLESYFKGTALQDSLRP